MKLTRREFIRGFLAVGGSMLLTSAPLHLFAQDKSSGRTPAWTPAYDELEQAGQLADRIEQAHALFENCRCCPRQCGVNRLAGERGFCRAPARVMVYSAHPHFGEEIPLVGTGGSGTIFFSNCNLRCVFCQNWPISQEGRGWLVEDAELAELMIKLQEIGCHNINLVTPTHVMPNILKATRIALKRGLRLPLVYNTSGYERVEIVKLLDGIVDIYLPDFKYTDPDKAAMYSSGASDYPQMAKTSIAEMHRQVGELQVLSDGIARQGVIIRHLVMPNRVAGTREFVRWVAENLSRSTYVNIMAQYHVDYQAYNYAEIARGITVEEFLESIEWAQEYGLTNLDKKSLTLWNYYRK
ncbi:MAG: radical SAM protein [Spirochaetaceae bacterium]|nr:MAG: radical SAM protein [Spirochaetaceae bacterium]